MNGKCECGETDPDYVAPHVHNFVNGECECGEKDANYVPPTDGTATNPHALTVPGTLDVDFAGGMNPVWYVFTATESKTLSITLSSNNACMAYGVDVDDVVYTEAYETNVKVNLTAGTTYYVGFCSQDNQAAEYTVTAEYVVSPYEAVIYEGKYNTVTFTAEEVAAGTATRKLVIATASSYQFAGDLFVASVVAADGTVIERDSNYAYTLAAGEYTLTFGMFSIFGIEADKGISLNVEDQNAEDDDDQGDVTGESDFVVGDNSVTLTDEEANDGKNFTFVAESAGTYTFSGLLAIVSNSEGMQIGRMEVFLEAGTYTITLVNIEGVGGDFTLTIAYTAPAGSGDGEGDGEGGNYGTEENPTEITLPAEDLATNGDSWGYAWYTFTATESGIITVTYSNENTMVKIYNVANLEDSDFKYGSQAITLKVKANTTYNLGLGVWDAEEGVTASVTFEAVEEGALADKGSMELDKETTFDVTDADITAGGFTVTLYSADAGEYSITSGDLMVSSVTTEDGTVIARNDNYRYELEADTQYIITFSTSYVYGAGEYTATAAYNYPEGHAKNPIWIYGLGDSVTATYKGDCLEVWYQFYANANGVVTITTENTSALIMIKPEGVEENIRNMVDGEWTGSVSLTVMQGRKYLIAVCDCTYGEEELEIVFTPALTEGEYVGDGSAFTPSIMTNDTTSAYTVGWDNTYFVYTAAGNGTLTLTTTDANCSWAIATEFGNWETVEGGTLSIALEMDQKAYIAISTTDDQAATINFTVSFKADPTSARFEGPVNSEGTAANEVVVAENTWVELSFQGVGQFQIIWDNSDAKVELVDFWVGNTVLENGDIITGDAWMGSSLMIYFEGYAAGTVNVTITPYVAESSSNSLVIGDNTIEVQDTSMGDTYALPVNADETVTYVLTVGTNGVLILSDGTVLTAEGSTTEITVPAGETVTVGIGALSWSDNVAVISVAIAGTTTPDEGGDEPGTSTEGTGTATDPIIITELPYTVSFEGDHDKYLKYTVTEDCTIVITYTAGYVSGLPTNFEKNASAKSYTGEVKAGDVLNINPWGSVNATYTIAVATADEGGEDEGEDTVVAEPVASVTIAAPGNFKASGWQEFYTVATSGNYVITAENYDSIQKTYIQVKVNGGDTILVAKGAELENCMPYTIALNAGDVVTIQLYGWSDADKGIEVTINLSPVA